LQESPLRQTASIAQEISKAGIRSRVLVLAREGVGNPGTAPSAVVEVFAPLTKAKSAQWNKVTVPQRLQPGVVLPYTLEAVLIDAAQFDVGKHGAGRNDPVGPNGK